MEGAAAAVVVGRAVVGGAELPILGLDMAPDIWTGMRVVVVPRPLHSAAWNAVHVFARRAHTHNRDVTTTAAVKSQSDMEAKIIASRGIHRAVAT